MKDLPSAPYSSTAWTTSMALNRFAGAGHSAYRVRKRLGAVEKRFWGLNEDHRAEDRSIKTSKSAGTYNNRSINFRSTAAIPTPGGLFQQPPWFSVHSVSSQYCPSSNPIRIGPHSASNRGITASRGRPNGGSRRRRRDWLPAAGSAMLPDDREAAMGVRMTPPSLVPATRRWLTPAT